MNCRTYICHHYQPNDNDEYASKYSRIVSLFCLILSDIKMLFFGLSFMLYVLQLTFSNGTCGSEMEFILF